MTINEQTLRPQVAALEAEVKTLREATNDVRIALRELTVTLELTTKHTDELGAQYGLQHTQQLNNAQAQLAAQAAAIERLNLRMARDTWIVTLAWTLLTALLVSLVVAVPKFLGIKE